MARAPTTAAVRPRPGALLIGTYDPRMFAAGRRIFVRDAETRVARFAPWVTRPPERLPHRCVVTDWSRTYQYAPTSDRHGGRGARQNRRSAA